MRYSSIKPFGDGNREALLQGARALGVNPLYLGAIISFETGSTFNPGLWGGKKNSMLGLIQFNPENQARYGVHAGQSFAQQMPAVVAFLKDSFRSAGRSTHGASLADLYAAVLTGSPNGSRRARDINGTTVDNAVPRMVDRHMQTAARRFGLSGGGTYGSDMLASAYGTRGFGNNDSIGSEHPAGHGRHRRPRRTYADSMQAGNGAPRRRLRRYERAHEAHHARGRRRYAQTSPELIGLFGQSFGQGFGENPRHSRRHGRYMSRHAIPYNQSASNFAYDNMTGANPGMQAAAAPRPQRHGGHRYTVQFTPPAIG